MADFVEWAKPDFGKFGEEAKHIGDAFSKAIAALKEAGDMKEDGANEFPTQWFECFANPVMCLMVYFVPCYTCCLTGRTLEKVDSTYERELINGLVTGLLYCGPCYHASRRTALRKKYNLKGSKGMDCILSCFCGACLLCQEAIAVHKYDNLTVPFAFPPDPNAKPAAHAPAPPHATGPPPPAGGPQPGAAYMVPPPGPAPPPGMAPPPAAHMPPPGMPPPAMAPPHAGHMPPPGMAPPSTQPPPGHL